MWHDSQVWHVKEGYFNEPCLTSEIELFAKIIVKSIILDVWQRSEYTSVLLFPPADSNMLKVNKTDNNAKVYSGSCQTFMIESFAREREIFWQKVLSYMFDWLLNKYLQLVKKTAWKVSKYGVISGPYFPVFSPNTGKYGLELTPYLNPFHAVKEVVFVQSWQ